MDEEVRYSFIDWGKSGHGFLEGKGRSEPEIIFLAMERWI